jgi:hypothetical protein
MAVVPRRSRMPTLSDPVDEVAERASKWFVNHKLAKQIKDEQEGSKDHPGYRKWLLDRIISKGKVIDSAKGHKAITFPYPLGGLYGLKAQRAVSPVWNSMVAAGLLNSKGVGVLRACMSTQWEFRPEKMQLVVNTLRAAGVLDECVADGYPNSDIDPDLVTRYHMTHQDVITEKDMDSMIDYEEKWSLIPLLEPLGEILDDD